MGADVAAVRDNWMITLDGEITIPAYVPDVKNTWNGWIRPAVSRNAMRVLCEWLAVNGEDLRMGETPDGAFIEYQPGDPDAYSVIQTWYGTDRFMMDGWTWSIAHPVTGQLVECRYCGDDRGLCEHRNSEGHT